MTHLDRLSVMKAQIANLRAGVRSIHLEALERKDTVVTYKMGMIQSLLHDANEQLIAFEEEEGRVYR